ncbi:MAG: hypothetical protein ACI808_003181, partial [Paraglaciecola sp.]
MSVVRAKVLLNHWLATVAFIVLMVRLSVRLYRKGTTAVENYHNG